MMETYTFSMTTDSVEQTQRVAECIGEHIDTPLVIALNGTLGAGKTAFIQGLARGLGVSERYYVTSPTFTLINEYPARLKLYHIDFYRIFDMEEVYELGLEEILNNGGVAAIEWADRFKEIIPQAHLAVDIEPGEADIRKFHMTAYGRWPVNLLKGIGNSAEESPWQ